MKFLLGFCLLLTLATIILSKSARFGKPAPGDILLYRENVVRLPLRSRVQEYYLAYPPLGVYQKVNVTAVFIYDHFTNSSGAVPQLVKAKHKATNPRFNSTMVLLKSQRSYGINSTVEFFGKFYASY